MPTVTDFNHRPLMRGKNLAVVLRYARIKPCAVIRVDHAVNVGTQGRYAVTFYFEDARGPHDQCLTYWRDWRVLLDWLNARRSWKHSVHRIRFAAPDIAELAIPEARKRLSKDWLNGLELSGAHHNYKDPR